MDPKWWYRLGIVVVIIAFIVLITRMTMLAFSPKASHLDQNESAAVGKPAPSQPVR
jgi:hypothetical protein